MKIRVKLSGIRPIMFDRFAGMKEALDWKQKAYLSSDGSNTLTIPALNIMSFLSAQNSESAPQRVIGRGWKTIAKAAQSFVSISPLEIPITREGEPVILDEAIEAGYLKEHVSKAIVMKGKLCIPSEKSRAVLADPWEIEFEIDLYEQSELNDTTLKKLFVQGGIMIGLGTYRGVFGKFKVDLFEIIK